jgi:hypothetical protein
MLNTHETAGTAFPTVYLALEEEWVYVPRTDMPVPVSGMATHRLFCRFGSAPVWGGSARRLDR